MNELRTRSHLIPTLCVSSLRPRTRVPKSPMVQPHHCIDMVELLPTSQLACHILPWIRKYRKDKFRCRGIQLGRTDRYARPALILCSEECCFCCSEVTDPGRASNQPASPIAPPCRGFPPFSQLQLEHTKRMSGLLLAQVSHD